MHPLVRLPCFGLFALLISVPATAQEVALEMSAVGGDSGAGPVIIGGEPAKASDWPATFIFRTAAGFCTSTAIGGRLILTAAHCVDDGARGTVTVGGQVIAVTCNHHPDYDLNYTADVAVCTALRDVQVPSYERINSHLSRVQEKDTLTLLGYGCRQVGGGGPAEALYQGVSVVRMAPTGSDLYTETRGEKASPAAVCFGDSGGAAYTFDGALRFVIGVNSRGDIKSRSLITTVAIPRILDFIKAEAAKAGSLLCGIDQAAQRCRG